MCGVDKNAKRVGKVIHSPQPKAPVPAIGRHERRTDQPRLEVQA
jgi:hypothetical protein